MRHIGKESRFEQIGILCFLFCLYKRLFILHILLIIDHTTNNQIRFTVFIFFECFAYNLITPVLPIIIF